MTKSMKQFTDAGLAEMKRGYIVEPATGDFVCLICGERFVSGRIYPMGEELYEAGKAVQLHIKDAHSSVFEVLLGLEKKETGLTNHQKELLRCFYQNRSDKEIAVQMENGNTSTIRNQRFAFREKAKQAKLFLAVMELLEEQGSKAGKLVAIPPGVSMADERFNITEAENEKIVATYFPQGPHGPISTFPRKEKRKIAILRQLMQRFDPGRKYSEPEVNAILESAFDDYVTLRRYMIEYGFLDRLSDGSSYWVKK